MVCNILNRFSNMKYLYLSELTIDLTITVVVVLCITETHEFLNQDTHDK